MSKVKVVTRPNVKKAESGLRIDGSLFIYDRLFKDLYESRFKMYLNPLKGSGVRWLHFKCSVQSRSNLHF